MIIRWKRCDRKSASRFYPMLRKFLSDSNEICTIGAHYDGDHITNFVARDNKIIIFLFFSSLVSISPLRNLQLGPQTWRNNTKKSKLRQNALLGQNLNSLRSHFYEWNVLLGFLRFRTFAVFRRFEFFWYTLYMKLNQPKCHFIAPSHSQISYWSKLDNM